LQNASWKPALIGKEKDFPELAASLQAAGAAITHGLRFQGSAAYVYIHIYIYMVVSGGVDRSARTWMHTCMHACFHR